MDSDCDQGTAGRPERELDSPMDRGCNSSNPEDSREKESFGLNPRSPRKKMPARLALGTREAEYGCNHGSCLRIITWLTTQVF